MVVYGMLLIGLSDFQMITPAVRTVPYISVPSFPTVPSSSSASSSSLSSSSWERQHYQLQQASSHYEVDTEFMNNSLLTAGKRVCVVVIIFVLLIRHICLCGDVCYLFTEKTEDATAQLIPVILSKFDYSRAYKYDTYITHVVDTKCPKFFLLILVSCDRVNNAINNNNTVFIRMNNYVPIVVNHQLYVH